MMQRCSLMVGYEMPHGSNALTFNVCFGAAVVVNFYAPWCPWCQRLEPTWEAVTQEAHTKYPDSDGRIRFAKVPHFAGLQCASTVKTALLC